MQLTYDTKDKCFYPCNEDFDVLEDVQLKVKHTLDGTIYCLCDKEYTEDEMFNLYNDYVEEHDVDYMIYYNNDDFFDMYPSRLNLVLDVSNNTDYNVYDEYCTYERGIYLKSGNLAGCMDECIIEDMANIASRKKIK